MRAVALVMLVCLAACGQGDPVVNGTTATAAPTGSSGPDVPTAPTASIGITTAVGAGSVRPPAALAKLVGRWRVTGVMVTPGPVSAVDVDDPTLMGAVLLVTPNLLTWEPHEGGFFTDTCPDPQIGPGSSVRCAEEQFGPPDMHMIQDGNRLRINWYDGAVLLLSRVE